MSRRIAVVTPDVLSLKMAGPAIRAYNIAEQLSRTHEVKLISTTSCEIEHPQVSCSFAPWHALQEAVGDASVVVLQGFVSARAPWLLRSEKVLVIDLYDPLHLEQLEQLKGESTQRRRATLDITVRMFNEQIVRGDFFLCASEEQRQLWLGHLGAFGRLNPENYQADDTLRRLLAVCPFGAAEAPPVRTGLGIRGAVPGIGDKDKVILWAGGVYNWLDPLTLVRAVDRLCRVHDDVRLFFLGMKHPNPEIVDTHVADQTRALSHELGLTGKYVFFHEEWTPYAERQNYLLDADVGVSTHVNHLETQFAFRTRVLDYLWASLPVVSTRGDTFARLIEAEGLGLTVPEQDPASLSEALALALYDIDFADSCRANGARVLQRFTWPRALEPLTRFCDDPSRAPDAGPEQRRFVRYPTTPPTPVAQELRRALVLARQGGVRLVTERAAVRIGRGLRDRKHHA